MPEGARPSHRPGSALLEHDGQTAPVDLAELEEDLRRGRVPPHARLHHPPWTGPDFRPLAEIPALAEAADSPDARFVDHLRRWRFPWATLVLSSVVGTMGLLQQSAAAVRAPADHPLPRFFASAAVGYDELLMAGRWWTPWASQLSHANALHLVPNLLVLAWMGYRVERALGPGAMALVAASAVAVGTLGIAFLEPMPAIGSSVLAFGLWGAVLAIGFRQGDALAQLRVRGRYGFGNLPIFAVLFAGSLGTASATHVGHAGGLLGGIAAAMVVSAEAFAPVRTRRRVLLGNLALAGLVAALPCLVALLGPVPQVVGQLATTVQVDDAGASLRLPRRMAEQPRTILGMPAWTTSVNSGAAVFVGLDHVHPGEDVAEALRSQWAAALDETVEVAPAPPDPGLPPGDWLHLAFTVRTGERGEVVDRVVEHVLVRGRSLLRAGYRLDGPGEQNREALYQHALASLEVGEPPALRRARLGHDRNPDSPRLRYELARTLAELDRSAEADALLGPLAEREDDWAWYAARLRLSLWARAAEEQGAAFRGGGQELAAAQAWVEGWLDRAAPQDEHLLRPGVAFLAATGACAAARDRAAVPVAESLAAELAQLAAACR